MPEDGNVPITAERYHPALAPRRRLLPWLAGGVAAAACAAGYFIAWPSGPLHGGGAVAAPVRTADPALQTNSVARQAAEWGVAGCMAEIATVSDFLTANQTYTAVSSAPRDKVGESMFAATIAAKDKNGLTSLSTLTAASAGGGCNTSYQTFASFRTDCEAAHRAYFPGFSRQIAAGEMATTYAGDNSSLLFLMPTPGGGCAAVKTQVIFQVDGGNR